MKILLLIFLLCSSCFAQFEPFDWFTKANYDARTTAYFTKLDDSGIAYNQALKNELDDYFFAYFRPYGILDSIQAIFWLATDSSLTLTDTTRCKQNLLSANYTLTTVNALTWQLGLGCAGNGTTSYFSTGFNPVSDSTYFKRYSSMIFGYSRTNGVQNTAIMGASDGTNFVHILPRWTGDLFYHDIFSGLINVSNSNSSGLFTVTRGTDSLRAYRNAVWLKGTATASTKVNREIFIHARNNSGTPAVWSNRQILFVGWGLKLSEWGINILNTGMERWADYKGVGVE